MRGVRRGARGAEERASHAVPTMCHGALCPQTRVKALRFLQRRPICRARCAGAAARRAVCAMCRWSLRAARQYDHVHGLCSRKGSAYAAVNPLRAMSPWAVRCREWHRALSALPGSTLCERDWHTALRRLRTGPLCRRRCGALRPVPCWTRASGHSRTLQPVQARSISPRWSDGGLRGVRKRDVRRVVRFGALRAVCARSVFCWPRRREVPAVRQRPVRATCGPPVRYVSRIKVCGRGGERRLNPDNHVRV